MFNCTRCEGINTARLLVIVYHVPFAWVRT